MQLATSGTACWCINALCVTAGYCQLSGALMRMMVTAGLFYIHSNCHTPTTECDWVSDVNTAVHCQPLCTRLREVCMRVAAATACCIGEIMHAD
jgi:hypothetical protein